MDAIERLLNYPVEELEKLAKHGKSLYIRNLARIILEGDEEQIMKFLEDLE
jgi:hypothetical protein